MEGILKKLYHVTAVSTTLRIGSRQKDDVRKNARIILWSFQFCFDNSGGYFEHLLCSLIWIKCY